MLVNFLSMVGFPTKTVGYLLVYLMFVGCSNIRESCYTKIHYLKHFNTQTITIHTNKQNDEVAQDGNSIHSVSETHCSGLSANMAVFDQC